MSKLYDALIEGFTYDSTGNRLSKTLGIAPVLNYSYAATDHKLSNAGDGARSFDANGNSTVIPGTGTISYDERNRLMGTSLRSGVKPNYTYSGVSNIYNARGERVQSQRTTFGPTQIMLFTYDEAGKLLASGNDKSADEIVYMDSIPVARVNGGVINPIEADHLGSPRVLQDAAGSSAVWTWNLLSNSATGSNAFGEQVPSSPVTEFNLRFPGQYADGNGLSYNYFRDYEAGTGRYVESDPIGLRGGVSTFGYVGQRPVLRSDPKGLFPIAALGCVGGGCEAVLGWCAAVVVTVASVFTAEAAIDCAQGNGMCAKPKSRCDGVREKCHNDCLDQWISDPGSLPGEPWKLDGDRRRICYRQCVEGNGCGTTSP